MHNSEGSTVIVVDDDREVLRSRRFLLETEGFNVLAFGSAEELLAHAELPVKACFVVDYRMPLMNGLDLITRMREKRNKLFAILITGYPDEEIDERAAKAGIRVIRKPHLDDGLLEGIREVLRQAAE